MPSARLTPSSRAGSASIQGIVLRQQRPGLDLVRIGTPDCCQFDLTLHPLANEDLAAMFYRLQDVLQECKATPVLQFTFGSLESLCKSDEAMRLVFGEFSWPVTCVAGVGATTGGLAGLQVLAVSDRPVTRVSHKNRVVASIFEDGSTRHCVVGGLGDSCPTASRADQTRQTLEELESILRKEGFALDEVMRTWFYLDEILSWYDDFNRVRTQFYSKHHFRVGSLPASTGVAAKNLAGSALALSAWAVQSVEKGPYPACEILSPLQCAATEYGSSFSRAVEIKLPVGRRLLVSGTASIEPGGKTVWMGDIQRQIQLSMEVVDAILKSRGMSFCDTVRASLYFKRPEYCAAFTEWCSQSGFKLPPGVPIHCDICRDDLLFEIELDTVAAD